MFPTTSFPLNWRKVSLIGGQLGKELVAQSHSEGRGPWLRVSMYIGDKWCLSGPMLTPALFNH